MSFNFAEWKEQQGELLGQSEPEKKNPRRRRRKKQQQPPIPPPPGYAADRWHSKIGARKRTRARHHYTCATIDNHTYLLRRLPEYDTDPEHPAVDRLVTISDDGGMRCDCQFGLDGGVCVHVVRVYLDLYQEASE